jgi:hypothetical protein
VFGGWVLQVERAASVSMAAAPQALAAAGAGQPHCDHKSPPASQTAFKSAGLKRNRPEPSARLAPMLRESLVSSPADTSSCALAGADPRAPAVTFAGHDLLTQFCVARR